MGWSEVQKVADGSDYYNNDNYVSNKGSWFFNTWWNNNHWARTYTNETDVAIQLVSISFLACSGHSNGKGFESSSGWLSAPGVTGGGCTFNAKIYVTDKNGNKVDNASTAKCIVKPINKYNCYYGGYGNVCTTDPYTSFGAVGYYKDKYDTSNPPVELWRIPREFKFKEESTAPVVPPGGKLHVVINVTNWTASTSLLVITADDASFTDVWEPAEDPTLLWRWNGKEWKKEVPAHIYTENGWIQLGSD